MGTKRRGRPRKSEEEKRATKEAYMKRYRAAHKEDISQYNHEYSKTHRKEIQAKRRENPHIAEYQKEWKNKNREKWNAYMREYRKRKKLDNNNEV